jgi:hypothetical protein
VHPKKAEIGEMIYVSVSRVYRRGCGTNYGSMASTVRAVLARRRRFDTVVL